MNVFVGCNFYAYFLTVFHFRSCMGDYECNRRQYERMIGRLFP